MQDAHTLYMDFNNLVSIQIKFSFLQLNFFTYIHFQCQWAISMEAKLVYKNVVTKFMDAIHVIQMCINPKMECQINCSHSHFQ
jgi:hypothetical protein